MHITITKRIKNTVKNNLRLTHTNTISHILQKESTLIVYNKYPVRTDLRNLPECSANSAINSYRLSHGHPVIVLRYLQNGFFRYRVIGHITNSLTFTSLRDEVIQVKNDIENRLETLVLYKKSFEIEKNDFANLYFYKDFNFCKEDIQNALEINQIKNEIITNKEKILEEKRILKKQETIEKKENKQLRKQAYKKAEEDKKNKLLNIAYNQKQEQEHTQEKTDRIARLEKKAKEISFPERNPSKDHNIENNIEE
jgi:hypothetical protein